MCALKFSSLAKQSRIKLQVWPVAVQEMRIGNEYSDLDLAGPSCPKMVSGHLLAHASF